MSRICIQSEFNHQPLSVVIGWDRPTKSCFMQFELTDEQEADPAFLPVTKVACATMYQELDVEDVSRELTQLGVPVPAAAVAELHAHMANNVGNHIVQFGRGGERTVLL